MLVETSAPALIEMLKNVPGRRRLILEEGTQSEWLSQVLRPYVLELVVVCPTKKPGKIKSDFEDAFARAEELRIDEKQTRVFKPMAHTLPLREAQRLHSAMNKDVVRAKNRFKALLRSRGVVGLTKDIYDPEPEDLEKVLQQVPPSVAFSAEAMLEQICTLQDLRSRASELMHGEAEKSTAFKLLMTVPGIGPTRAAQLLAVVVTPERFRTSHQFWSYCGLGVLTEATGEYDRSGARKRDPMTRGLKFGNPTLKNVFKGAAELIVERMSSHPLNRHYQQLLKKGTKENLAKLTLARKLAAITLAVWKTKKEYDPTKHKTFE
jgi:transposase